MRKALAERRSNPRVLQDTTPDDTTRNQVSVVATPYNFIMKEEEFKHQCLVRWLLKKRLEDKDAAHRFLHGYTENGKHKKGWNELHPCSRLENDVKIEWSLGNRGKYNDWRQDKKD